MQKKTTKPHTKSLKRSVWAAIQHARLLQSGDVDSLLSKRHALQDEILKVSEYAVSPLHDTTEHLHAQSVAAGLFLLMLEKSDAAAILHPYVDQSRYPDKLLVNEEALNALLAQARDKRQRLDGEAERINTDLGALDDLGDPDPLPISGTLDPETLHELSSQLPDDVEEVRRTVLAVAALCTRIASFSYVCFSPNYEVGLRLASRARELLRENEDLFLSQHRLPDFRFLIGWYENGLQSALCETRAGRIIQAKEHLQECLDHLTIAYQQYVDTDAEAEEIGGIEDVLIQILGELAQQEWLCGNHDLARARIYRALTILGSGWQVKDRIRLAYGLVIAARIEASLTTTQYSVALSLMKQAEKHFKAMERILHKEHYWLTRAQLTRAQCYVNLGRIHPAQANGGECAADLLTQISHKVREEGKRVKTFIDDAEERNYVKAELARTQVWILEQEADNGAASFDHWRECYKQAASISRLDRIPQRLKTEGLLHEGRALLNLALLTKDESKGRRLRVRGCQKIEEAIKLAWDRQRRKIEANGYLTLAEGLAKTDPVEAAQALREADRIIKQAPSQYLKERLKKLGMLLTADGFATLYIDEAYETAKQNFDKLYFDLFETKAGGNWRLFQEKTGLDKNRYYHFRNTFRKPKEPQR